MASGPQSAVGANEGGKSYIGNLSESLPEWSKPVAEQASTSRGKRRRGNLSTRRSPLLRSISTLVLIPQAVNVGLGAVSESHSSCQTCNCIGKCGKDSAGESWCSVHIRALGTEAPFPLRWFRYRAQRMESSSEYSVFSGLSLAASLRFLMACLSSAKGSLMPCNPLHPARPWPAM